MKYAYGLEILLSITKRIEEKILTGNFYGSKNKITQVSPNYKQFLFDN